MKRVMLGIVIGALGLFAYQRAHRPQPMLEQEPEPVLEMATTHSETPAPTPRFHCDGRTRCSEMTSCEEATFFLQHCPGVKMDGEGDGVPCERQWCGRH